MQVVFDRALKRRESHGEFYRELYRDDLERLRELGAAGLFGGRGDPAANGDGDSWGGRAYDLLFDFISGLIPQSRSRPRDAGPLRLLELGAGTGYLSCRLAGPDLQVELVDNEPLAVEVSSEVARILDKSPFVRQVCADLFALDLDASAYDVVLSIGLLEELDPRRREAFLLLGRRLLRPGGLLVVGVPNFWSPVMFDLWRRFGKANEAFYSTGSLRQVLQRTGYQDVGVRAAGPVLPTKEQHWQEHRLSRWLGMIVFAWGTQSSEAAGGP